MIKTLVIVNPKSSNNKLFYDLDYIINKLSSYESTILKYTEYQGHATKLTSNYLSNGIEKIICIGGDGTINEVINGFFYKDKIINPNSMIGIINNGTGGDFSRTINIKKNIDINKLLFPKTKKIDLGKIVFLKDNTYRYFINIASLGLSSDVVLNVEKFKFLGGFLSFLFSTLYSIVNYKGIELNIKIDDEDFCEIFTQIVIGNGKFFGGGMKILPNASIEDELLDILLIENIKKSYFFKNIFKLYKGNLLSLDKVHLRKAKKLFINSNTSVKIESDGELLSNLPVEIVVIPKVLNLIV